MSILKNLNLNKKLALVALFLGIVALFVGNPGKGDEVTIDTKKIALSLERKTDTLHADKIASWLIEGRADYLLVDVRKDEKYEEYHIPGSVNFDVYELQEEPFSRNQKIVLYSDDEAQVAQAWFLLKAKNYPYVYRLYGGLQEWKDKILFPKLAADASQAEKDEFEKIRKISEFFGGKPQIGGEAVEDKDLRVDMPNIQMPETKLPVKKSGKPKREGC